MCGRIFIRPGGGSSLILTGFGIEGIKLPKLNNVAPTGQIPVIYHDGEKVTVKDMRWWLHPAWEKVPPHQKQARFNARIESVLTLNSFRAPIKRQRAVVPIDAFVEWQSVGSEKQPWYIEGKNDPLAIAAIWDVWQGQVYSCAILTQPASPSFSWLHDRMPVSLTLEQATHWIDPNENAEGLVSEYCHASVQLTERKIGREVNNARNKSDPVFID